MAGSPHASMHVAHRRSQRRLRPSLAVAHIAAAVIAGAVGILAGYYLLNLFGGSRYNLHNVSLPGIAHPHADRWARPAGQPAAPPAEAPPQVSIGDPPSTPTGGDPPPPATAATEVAANAPAQSVEPPHDPAQSAPSYDSEAFEIALTEARRVLRCVHCGGTGVAPATSTPTATAPCEYCHGTPWPGMTAEAYEVLCQLAEVVTSLRISPDQEQVARQRQDVEYLLQEAMALPDDRRAIGRMAGYRFEGGERRSPGILLAGTVQETGGEPGTYWTRVLLFGLPKVVTVISSGPSGFAPHERVAILGRLLDAPVPPLPGLGEEQVDRAVWGGFRMTLPGAGP